MRRLLQNWSWDWYWSCSWCGLVWHLNRVLMCMKGGSPRADLSRARGESGAETGIAPNRQFACVSLSRFNALVM